MIFFFFFFFSHFHGEESVSSFSRQISSVYLIVVNEENIYKRKCSFVHLSKMWKTRIVFMRKEKKKKFAKIDDDEIHRDK